MPDTDTVMSSTWLEANRSQYQALITHKLGAGESHAVDEVWQELHLAVEKASSTGKVDNPSSWIRQVINHKVADYLRRKQRKDRLETHLSEKMEPSLNPTPFDWVLVLEDRQQVRDALAQCTSDNQEVLKLKYFSGASGSEISRVLKITPKAAEYRLHRAREQFRKFFTQSRDPS